MKKRNQVVTGLLLVIGVLILVNILADNFFFRLDLTADHQFTLSKATRQILKELKEPVTVTTYFSKKVPTELLNVRREFKDMLIEYSNVSKRKVVFDFVDPSDNEELEQKAQQSGLQPVVVNVRDKDEMKQQRAYVGAVLQLGEKTEVIPVVEDPATMEYLLSSAIKKLSIDEKPYIGLLQGQGEPSLAGIHQAYADLSVLYDVEPVYLTDTTYTLNKYKTLMIIAPKDTFKASFLNQLQKFYSEGGNLLCAIDRVDYNNQTGTGYVKGTELENWLAKAGITVDKDFVVDAKCGRVTAQIGQGVYQYIQFPYFPIITNFADHPATKGLGSVIFQFASTVSFTGDSSEIFTPLVFTSEKSNKVEAPVYFDINKNWTESDFPLQKLPIAAALQPKIKGKGKIIVISDGSFAVNPEGQQGQQQQIQPDNVNLLVNSVDWLSDDTGLIDLRTKSVTVRLIKELDDSKRAFLKYLNFFLPIILIIGYGIFRMNRNRNIRMKRMEAHYV